MKSSLFPVVARYGLLWIGIVSLILLLQVLRSGPQLMMTFSPWLLVLGGFMGMLLVLVDRLLQVYLVSPDQPLSHQIKQQLKERRVREALNILYQRRGEQQKLMTHNVVFLAVWMFMALFLFSSSTSVLSQGMILGVGLVLTTALVIHWRDRVRYVGSWYWMINRSVPETETRVVVGGMAAVFGLVCLMASW